MCLHSTSVELTAKEDIKVYKWLELPNHISPFYFKSYKLNTLYRLRKKLVRSPLARVHEGFHSFVNLDNRRVKLGWPTRSYFEMVVPKGAKYYLGDNNDIVSTSIKVPNKWKRHEL